MKNKAFTREFFQQAGHRGGSKTATKGKEFYQSIGKLGGNTRWAKREAKTKETV